MFDRLTLAPPSEDEMEDFHDYDDEENSELDSKLDEFEEEEEEDEEEETVLMPPLGPPAMATPEPLPAARQLPTARKQFQTR